MQPKLTLLLLIVITFTIQSNADAQNGAQEPGQANAAPAFMYTSQFEFSDKVYVVKVEKKPTSDIYKYITTISVPAPAAIPDPVTPGAEEATGTTSGTSTADGKVDNEVSYTFKLIELKPDVFRSEFITTIRLSNSVTGINDSLKKAGRMELLRKEIDRLFYSIVASSFDVEAKAPPAGYMTFDNFKSRGENKEPVIVAHDYFSYYAGIGWSKNKLLESVAENTRDLLETRAVLENMYSDQAKKDSIDIRFNLKDTKVKRMLTDPQRSYLRSRGFNNELLNTIFPQYLTDERIDESGIRKPSRELSVIVENIQHSIADMKGEIRRLKMYEHKSKYLKTKDEAFRKKEEDRNNRAKQASEIVDLDDNLKSIYQEFETINTSKKNNQIRLQEVESEIANLEKKLNLNRQILKSNLDSLEIIQAVAQDSTALIPFVSEKETIKLDLGKLDAQEIILKPALDNVWQFILDRTDQNLQANFDKKNLILAQDDLKKNQPEVFATQLSEVNNNIRAELATKKILQLRENAERNLYVAESNLLAAQNEKYKAEADLHKPVTPEGVRVHAVQVEFAAGNLKNVMVIGTMRSDEHDREDTIKFINPHPIPFSAIRDFNYGAQLYSFNHRDPPSNYRYWIHLADVFRYVPAFYVDAEDYSPADVAFTVKMDDKQTSYKVLNRSTVDKLLDARIYSDFVGLDDDTPNGLIQTEVSKRIILRPARQPIILNRRPFGFGGFLNYLEPHAALLKLENKNKFLKLDALSDTTYAANDTLTAFAHTVSRARAIDLLRYANFSIGAKLNLVVFDVPQFKSSYFLDIGTTLFRTSVIDSFGVARQEAGKFVRDPADANRIAYTPQLSAFNANSVVSFVELTWQIKPDHRLGFSVSPRISYLDLKSPRFQQVAKLKDDVGDAGGGTPFWMFSVQLNTFILPSENGRLFFRANYTFMYDHQKQDFFQAQLGYAFNILKRKPGQ